MVHFAACNSSKMPLRSRKTGCSRFSGRTCQPLESNPERDPIALIGSSHPGKGTASRDVSFEMVDVGRKVSSRGLVVASVLVQPWNRIGIGAAVRGSLAICQLQS